MLDSEQLLVHHRGRGVLLDTNLLVLLMVGRVNPNRIPNFKRTQNFDLEDLQTLELLVAWCGGKLVATPHILSQVSDLTDLTGTELERVRKLFRSTVQDLDEFRDPALQLVDNRSYSRLGLADASIESVCARKILVVTTDLDLYIALTSSGYDALNFNHGRALGWRSRR